MKSEADPITDDEWLLRRVHKDRFKTDRVPVISNSAFEPRIKGRDPDVDGISLYREACLVTPEEILSDLSDDKKDAIGIVRVRAGELRSLGVDIKPDPVPSIKGHSVLPMLNCKAYENSKSDFTELLTELAKFASRDDRIVRRPPLMS